MFFAVVYMLTFIQYGSIERRDEIFSIGNETAIWDLAVFDGQPVALWFV